MGKRDPSRDWVVDQVAKGAESLLAACSAALEEAVGIRVTTAGRGVELVLLPILLLAAPHARAEATFRIPGLSAPEAGSREEAEKRMDDGVTAPKIATLVATKDFWALFGDSCASDFTLAGLGGAVGAGSTPAERLAAIERFEACTARFRVLLDSQADSAEELVAASSLKTLVDRQVSEPKSTEKAKTDFLGFSFGVGVGISHSLDDVVSEATVGAGGVIVATKDDTTLPRVILESHYYGLCKTQACREGTRGIGPYFGIVAKSDQLISGFSAGVMYGWKDTPGGDPAGLSIGLGAILDDDVKSLADGFEVGQPVPAGESGPRFVEKSRWSGILFFTRTF